MSDGGNYSWSSGDDVMTSADVVGVTEATSVDNIPFAEYVFSRELTVARLFDTYAPPIFLVLGSIGNALAVTLLTRRRFHHSSVCVYMAALAVANTLALYVGCGLNWIAVVSRRPHVAVLQDWICKIWNFSHKLCEATSSWLLVAMATDRFLVTWLPLRAMTLCTPFIAKFVNAFLVVGLTSIHIHSMWTYEVTASRGRHTCSLNNSQHDFETEAWPYIAATFSHYLPLLMLMAFACLLVGGTLCLSNRGAPRDAEHGTAGGDGGGGDSGRGGGGYLEEPNQERLTYVTMVLAAIFLLWSLPFLIHNMLPYFLSSDWFRPPLRFDRYYLAYTVLQTAKFFNYTLSFPVYFALLPSIRAELRALSARTFSSCRRRTEQELTDTGAANGLLRMENSSKIEVSTVVSRV